MCRPGCSFEGSRTFARAPRANASFTRSVSPTSASGFRRGLFVQANEQIPLQGAVLAPRDGEVEGGGEGREQGDGSV